MADNLGLHAAPPKSIEPATQTFLALASVGLQISVCKFVMSAETTAREWEIRIKQDGHGSIFVQETKG
jgi:hypothetical protein